MSKDCILCKSNDWSIRLLIYPIITLKFPLCKGIYFLKVLFWYISWITLVVPYCLDVPQNCIYKFSGRCCPYFEPLHTVLNRFSVNHHADKLQGIIVHCWLEISHGNVVACLIIQYKSLQCNFWWGQEFEMVIHVLECFKSTLQTCPCWLVAGTVD